MARTVLQGEARDKRGEMALDDPIGDGQQADNIHTYSVTELSGSIKRTIEDAYGMVRVRGELSKVTRPPSGHIYFDLKDEKCVLASVVWKTNALRLRVKPEQGLEVICTGRLTTFGPQSKYQLVVEHMAPAGMGALMALLEERKQKLSAEGLFAPERKVKLPFLPRVIGVVTSPTGAVLRDILHRLGDRFPRHVIVWPTLVQGDRAAGEIAAAIEGFNRLPPGGPIPRPDVLIVARGGGSIEDLWPFNEEIVVRAAAASEIPLISAVGHETDTTLIDFAADVRAPTPTAAAEMAVPVRADLLGSVIELDRRLVGAMERKLGREADMLRGLGRALPRLEDLLAVPAQRFDHVSVSLGRCMAIYVERKGLTLAGVAGRLRGETYLSLLDRHVARIAEMGARLDGAVQHRVDRAGERLAARGGLLEVLSHKRTLERGFALVERGDGALVRHAAEVTAGDDLRLTFADGSVPVTVAGTAPEEGRQRRTKGTAKPTPEDQGRLI